MPTNRYFFSNILFAKNIIITNVLDYLERQLAFLAEYDVESRAAALNIRTDEEVHREWGENNGKQTFIYQRSWLCSMANGVSCTAVRQAINHVTMAR